MIQIPIEIGDVILTGRFKNKKVKVKEIGTDDYGLPTVNGRGIMKIRIEKLMPKRKDESMKTNIRKIIREELNKTILLESSPLIKHFQKTVKGKKKYFPNTPEYKKIDIIAEDPDEWETWINFAAKHGIDVKYDNNSDAYIITNSVREGRGVLHELDISDPDIQAEIEEYANMAEEIDRLNEQIKRLEKRFKELDAKFVGMLEKLEEELNNSKETFIRAKNILITIKKRGGERTTYKYKEAFEWLYTRVSPQMKKLIDETMEAHKTISQVKSSLAVQREGRITENWLTSLYNKVKSFVVNIIGKLRKTNQSVNQSLDKLEGMI